MKIPGAGVRRSNAKDGIFLKVSFFYLPWPSIRIISKWENLKQENKMQENKNQIQINNSSFDANNSLGVFYPPNFVEAQRTAKCLMMSSIVPKRYKPNPNDIDPKKRKTTEEAIADIMVAMNMAMRLKADPIMVMQHVYVVHGTPGLTAQFLIACFNMSGKFSAMQFKSVGTKGQDDYGYYAWALELSTNQEHKGTTVTVGMAKKKGWWDKPGSPWPDMTDQMLCYRAATFFTRTTAPEIGMGFQTKEEIEDMRDVTPNIAEETTKKTYSKTKIQGAKEAVIEGEAASVTTPPVAEKSQTSADQSTQAAQAASSWEAAKTKTVNPETGEIIQKTPQQKILEAELQKQKEQENV